MIPWGSFYEALDNNCKVVANTIIRGSFLDCPFPIVAEQQEKVAKTNDAWGTMDKSMKKSSFSVSTNSEQDKINEDVMEDLSRISNNVGLLMKQIQE